MHKELFNLIPTPTIGTELYEGYEGLQTYIDLESYDEVPRNFNNPSRAFSGHLKHRVLVATLLISSLWLNACGSHEPQKAPPTTAQKDSEKHTLTANGIQWSSARITSLKSDLSNLEEYKTNLNRFVVTVTMSAKTAQKATLSLRDEYKNVTSLVEPTIEYQGDTAVLTDFIDLSQSPLTERTFIYQINIDNLALKPFEVTLKPDLLVQGQKKFSDLFVQNKKLKIATFFLDEGSAFFTEGHDLQIEITTLVSQHGKIESFPEADVSALALIGQAGRHGGTLTVKTDLLVGDLEINLRGTNGGRGMEGNPVTERPEAGPRGTNSADHMTCRDRFFSRKVKLFRRNPEDPFPRETCRWECAFNATAGGAGKKGFPANNGLPGMPGGNSGTLQFIAMDVLNHSLKTSSTAGRGGDGGPPSAPGKGSDAGGPGEIKHSSCTFVPPLSPAGPDGDPAPPGSPGSDGEKQVSCVQIGNNEKQCE